MRSLLLAASFPPALGGIETLLHQTNRRLAEPPLVIAPRGSSAVDLVACGVSTSLAARAAYRPLWFAHPSLWYLAAWLPAAVRAARAYRPRVIQVGHVYLAPLGQLLAKRLRVPWVVYAYGQEVWRAGAPMGLGRVDKVLRGGALRSADAVLSPGSFTTGLLEEWGVHAQRVVCVPYGAEPRPHAKTAEPGSVLSVSRLVPRKGIDMMIRAIAQVPEVHYRVVGSGPDLERLRYLAEREGVTHRVRFFGRLEQGELDAEYQRCALFALPARRTADGQLEGYGLVYFEAAAWGRPVLAGRSGGEVDAVVDGETGVLVDGASLDQVVAVLRQLVRDPDRLRRMGHAGRQRVETTHNWTRAAEVVDAALARLG